MSKAMALVVGMLLWLPVSAQELVVFRDFRALPVLSHRTQGDWTYLRVAEGELAVKSAQILEIKNEPGGQAVAVPLQPQSAQGHFQPAVPASTASQPMPPQGWRPEPPQPQPEQQEYNEPPPEPEPEPEPEPPPLPPPSQKVE